MNYFNYEQELIVSLMAGGATPDAVDVLGKIESEMFSNGYIKNMFDAVVDLHSKGLDFTPLEVSEKTGMLLGDVVSMGQKSSGSPANVKAYAKRVRQGFYLRQAESMFTEIVSDIQNCNDERMIGDIAGKVEEAVKNLVVETDTKKPRQASEILEQYVHIIDQRYEGGESERRLRVGIDAIDEKTQGFNQTDLIIIAGCPGMGKTELMMSLVNGSANEEEGALVFSMEMDEYQLIERAVAIEGNLPISAARSPKGMSQEDWARFSMGVGRVKEKKFHVLDQAGLSVNEICAQARDHKMRHPKTNMICIDYVGLIPLQKADRHDIALGEVSRRLKQLAKELKTPVVLLAQVTSKNVESRTDKRPLPSDIKDSSRLQDDADWIIFPYRDEVYDEKSPAKGYAEINFAKARHGTKGAVYMGWKNGHFIDVNQAHAQAACSQSQQTAPMKKGF